MTPKERDILQNLKAYKPGYSTEAVEKKYGLTDIVKLASNENPMGCPIKESLFGRLLKNAAHYPDIASSTLPDQVAKLNGVSRSEVQFGNGSDDLLQMLALAYLEPEDEVVIAAHTFSNYQFVSNLMCANIITARMPDYAYSVKMFKEAITRQTKILFLANPNNPTGELLDHSDISTLLQHLPKTALMVLDEAYIEYANPKKRPKLDQLLSQYPNLVILRTFSKVYGLAGFRIGYAIGNDAIISNLAKVRQPFSINRLAIEAASWVLEKPQLLEKSIMVNEKGKKQLMDAFDALAIKTMPSEANFIPFFTEKLATDVFEDLLKKGVVIRPLGSFGMPHALRVTIGTMKQNTRFITTLKDVL